MSPQSLTLFDKVKNDEWIAGGISAATPLAIYIGVDFFITGGKQEKKSDPNRRASSRPYPEESLD